MGVDYSFVMGFGFELPEDIEEQCEGKYDADYYAFSEWFEQMFYSYGEEVAKYPLLTLLEVGSLSYGGDGRYGIAVKRLSKSIDYRDEFTSFVTDRDAPTDEELQQLSEAALEFGAELNFGWLGGIRVW